MDYFLDILKLLSILPFILFLIIFSMKIVNKYQKKSKYINVIDRVQIAPNTFLVIVSIIDKKYAIVTNNNSTTILYEIDTNLEVQNEEYKFSNLDDFIRLLKGKMTDEKK